MIYGRCLVINLFGEQEDHEENVFDVFRVGVVSSVNKKKCTARVYFENREETVSYDLKIIVPQTLRTKYYYMPDINEEVLCGFTSNETGFILGSYYSEVNKPVPEISEQAKSRVGIWIDNKNYIKWIEEERRFEIRTEKPIEFIVGD